MSILKSAAALLTAAAIGMVSLSSCSFGKKKYAGMNVTFPDFGKADAIVITTENHTVLIDSANQGDGKDIYEYCSALGRDRLEKQ